MRPLTDDRLQHLRAVADLPDLTATKYEVVRKLDRGGMGRSTSPGTPIWTGRWR